MYFVDRKNINKSITHMNQLLSILEAKKDWNDDEISKLALERIGQNIIECIIDIGNSMIDGFIMRDPGGYDDIIDILTDEKVITTEMEAPLKEVIDYRKVVVRDFHSVDHDQLLSVLMNNMASLNQFPTKVESYLINELGPVSAFLPEDSNVEL